MVIGSSGVSFILGVRHVSNQQRFWVIKEVFLGLGAFLDYIGVFGVSSILGQNGMFRVSHILGIIGMFRISSVFGQ